MEERDTLDYKVNGFCRFLSAVTGLPAIRGKTPFTPQFKGPFIVVWVNSFQPLPRDESEYGEDLEGDFVQRLRGLALVEFEVQAYGPGAIATLTKARAAIGTDIWVELTSQYGLGTSERGEVQNASAPLIDAAYEERAVFTCSFYVCVPQVFKVGYFNKDVVTVIDKGSGREYVQQIPTDEQLEEMNKKEN